MEIFEALDILRNSINEGSSWAEQVEKMKQLEAGTRGFNAKAAGDDKLRTNRQICLSHNLPTALDIVETEMVSRGLIPQTTKQAQRQAAAQQAQPQPAPQPQPQPTPKASIAETFMANFEKEKFHCIPTEIDFDFTSRQRNSDKAALYAETCAETSIALAVRRFIVSALLGDAALQTAFKEILKANGFTGEQNIKLKQKA